jgi:ADP-ribose pyrophosphatase
MSYRLIEKQVIFSGEKVRLELHHLENEEGTRIRREVCVHPGAVVILPFLADGRIILIRNRRYALGGLNLIELPAGTLETNEDPMNCAGRELLEETGYLAARLEPLGNFFSSPGILTEKLYAFAAYDLEKQSTALEEGEEIELQPTTLPDAIAMIKEGRIHDGKTIATLLMYEKFYRRS